MPNWCENDLTVTGDEKTIKRFFDIRIMFRKIQMMKLKLMD